MTARHTLRVTAFLGIVAALISFAWIVISSPLVPGSALACGQISEAVDRLPSNSLHLACEVSEENPSLVRIDVIGDVRGAVGFDFALDIPHENIAIVLNSDEQPFTLNSLFADANIARNTTANTASGQTARMVGVLFGDTQGIVGDGVVASLTLDTAELQEPVDITLMTPRLARVNAEGQAEYIDLDLGEPIIGISPGSGATSAVSMGTLPQAALDPLLIMIPALLLTFSMILIVWGGRQNRRRPVRARA